MKMIGCFPDPHPDELLYSACARFSARVRYPKKKDVLQELFGTTTNTAAVDLPSHLTKFASALPPYHPYTPDRFIDQNTLLPFYSPFLPNTRVEQLREDMRGDGSLAVHRRSGVMASRIPTPQWLRFCPLCVVQDRRQVGEAYWHRQHQIPGILACSNHLVFLENVPIRRDVSRNFIEFVSAEDAIRKSDVRYLNLSTHVHKVTLRLAQDAAWLIGQNSCGSDLSEIHGRYLRLLIDRGLATYTGSIHVRELLGEFRKYYSAELLELLHCEFTGADRLKTNWLLRLVRPPKHVQHPLYHLLLMQFLHCTPEEFFRLSTEQKIFGEGPWPCLNPAAEHFREPVISEYKLSSRLRGKRPTATFSCSCGFAYARSGPDFSPEDRLRIGRMISFGPVWEAKLKRLWKNSLLSLSEVGRRLRVDTLTVHRHAEQLKLPSRRPGKKSKPLNCTARLKDTRDSTAHVKKRRVCRAKWMSTTRQAPKATLKALRRKLPREYAWLLQNDVEWLKRHSPHSRRNVPSTSGVDWKERDAKYAVAVRVAAATLRNKLGRPIQVTKTALGKNLGAATLLQQKLTKMPLTAQVLAGVVETREQYATRRIWWAADLFIEEGVPPRYWQLVSRANIYHLRMKPEIKAVIEAAIQKLVVTLLLEEAAS